MVATVAYFHIQRLLNLAQVLIELPAQAGQSSGIYRFQNEVLGCLRLALGGGRYVQRITKVRRITELGQDYSNR